MYKGDFSPYPFENVPAGTDVNGLPASADKFWLCHSHPQPLPTTNSPPVVLKLNDMQNVMAVDLPRNNIVYSPYAQDGVTMQPSSFNQFDPKPAVEKQEHELLGTM